MDLRWDDPSTIVKGGCAEPLSQATATITVTGTVETFQAATGNVTVLSSPVAAGEVLTIGNVELVALNGPRVAGSDTFDGSLPSTAGIAASIAAAINDGSLSGWGVATASVSGSTVVITASGPGGNLVDVESSTVDILAPPAGSLTGGLEAATVTIGSDVFTAVNGPRTSGDKDFSVGPTNFDTAASLAEAINDPANEATAATASVSGDIVTLVAIPLGALGNFISLCTTSSFLTLSGECFCGGRGDKSSLGQSNTSWQIVGVNVYRSDTGERGPYFRLNDAPVGGLFYRDYTDNVLVEDEVVLPSQWVSKGDSSSNAKWQFCTQRKPVSKRAGQAIHANSPADVIVKVNGVQVPIESVFGPTGEITLINQPTFDMSTEKLIPPLLPTDPTDVLTITYYHNRNLVKSDLETKAKVFYRLTTVAVDSSMPSGYVETPLGWSPPLNVHNVEAADYIWREAVKRNTWILQQGGERVKLFIKRTTGVQCPCRIEEKLREHMAMPMSQGQINKHCPTCYGTGWVQGYEGPIDIIIAPDDAERRVAQTPNGRRLEHSYEVWTSPSPMLSQRDFIVKQTGERYSIGPVRRPASRGRPLQQHFSIAYIDEKDIRYQVPVSGVAELPWPETRTTDQRTPCNDGDPHPVGFDYQATPMQTEKENIPDEREQRGRTPVWENITY